jgi:hypothetical protein
MEKEGFERAINRLQCCGINIEKMVTDRHVQIRAYIAREMPAVDHRFDCWHVAKGTENAKHYIKDAQYICILFPRFKEEAARHLQTAWLRRPIPMDSQHRQPLVLVS